MRGPCAALLFFEHQVIDLGPVLGGAAAPRFRAVFGLDLGSGDAFGMDVALVTVPEPSTGLLVLIGLVSMRRRRRS